ncbi:MAG: hypothetical protein JOZ17_00005 [Acetobacteraceae bacterium]|nr:hypothetical protein [Acetobacteraceae bacterium]
MAEAVSPGSVRKAGGRPKGSRNKRTVELVQRAEAKGITPLDLMLEVMHDLWREGDRRAAFACAEKIAPYLHPRLAVVKQTVEAQVEQKIEVGITPSRMKRWIVFWRKLKQLRLQKTRRTRTYRIECLGLV